LDKYNKKREGGGPKIKLLSGFSCLVAFPEPQPQLLAVVGCSHSWVVAQPPLQPGQQVENIFLKV
jgi:hypothetical protein